MKNSSILSILLIGILVGLSTQVNLKNKSTEKGIDISINIDQGKDDASHTHTNDEKVLLAKQAKAIILAADEAAALAEADAEAKNALFLPIHPRPVCLPCPFYRWPIYHRPSFPWPRINFPCWWWHHRHYCHTHHHVNNPHHLIPFHNGLTPPPHSHHHCHSWTWPHP